MRVKVLFEKIFTEKVVKALIPIGTALLLLIITQEIFFTFSPLKRLELKLIDERFERRGPIDVEDSADVVILEITQKTYDQIPQPYKAWPWPRFILANVIENLEQAGARAIGIDLVMSNPDRMSRSYDTLLINTIRKYGNIVVAGKTDIAEAARITYSDEADYSVKSFTDTTYTGIKENFGNIFFQADSSIGFVQAPADYDNVYRRYRPFVSSAKYNQNFPTFGFALLNKYLGLSNTTVADVFDDHFLLGFKRIPRFDKNSMLINFYGADRTFPRYEFYKVLDDAQFKTVDEKYYEVDFNYWDDPNVGLLHQNVFRDKIVIIGSTMPEDKDFFNISISKSGEIGDNIIAGVEYYANPIQNVIWNDYIYSQSRSSEIIFLILLVIAVFYLSSYIKQRKIKLHYLLELLNLFVILGVVYSVYELAFYLFVDHHFLVSIISPALAVIFGYISSTVYHFVTERSQKKLIQGMFSTYVSKDLVDELITDPAKLQLGGVRRNLSILFSDIAGFTSLSEKMAPEELIEFINRYLTEMTNIVLKNNGTLDKYIGDAIMAFWNAPLQIDKHAYLACKTALEMQSRLKELRKEWQLDKKKKLNIRIGINTGDAVVGNIGGANRFDYTVMGDSVNLASRLEGVNKEYSTGIMISENTKGTVENDFIIREIDTIKVKGKEVKTIVYELLAMKEKTEINKFSDLIDPYHDAIELYKKRKFNAALESFAKILKSYPEDGPCLVYKKRCETYSENPPDENWDGVFVMTTK